MFWSYVFPCLIVVYGEEINGAKVSPGTHYWEDEYYTL